MALYELQQGGEHDVCGLLTTVSSDDRRIAYHGVPVEFVQAQADALGLPLHVVELPPAATNDTYESALRDALAELVAAGTVTIAFGDLFLADIRRYREDLCARIGVSPIFPVWGRDTRQFVEDFLMAGFRTMVVSVDLARLDAAFAGRMVDAAFLEDLPPSVDPCGENGEFHTFVTFGPNFATEIPVTPSSREMRSGYCYCEVGGT